MELQKLPGRRNGCLDFCLAKTAQKDQDSGQEKAQQVESSHGFGEERSEEEEETGNCRRIWTALLSGGEFSNLRTATLG
ncbi:hypothetical protein CDAR_165981 [Caerostris darwini]|uniref:Uncharacterized protein n=1 Tax=Caerostris darwini TaxID=1538125 RepID=A0AAV4RXC3_9ARAC|nr:hypothetical protein CDAR_165981 [Caerostris darwini]